MNKENGHFNFRGRNKNSEKELQKRVFEEAQYRISDITKNLKKLDSLMNDCVDVVNKLSDLSKVVEPSKEVIKRTQALGKATTVLSQNLISVRKETKASWDEVSEHLTGIIREYDIFGQ